MRGKEVFSVSSCLRSSACCTFLAAVVALGGCADAERSCVRVHAECGGCIVFEGRRVRLCPELQPWRTDAGIKRVAFAQMKEIDVPGSELEITGDDMLNVLELCEYLSDLRSLGHMRQRLVLSNGRKIQLAIPETYFEAGPDDRKNNFRIDEKLAVQVSLDAVQIGNACFDPVGLIEKVQRERPARECMLEVFGTMTVRSVEPYLEAAVDSGADSVWLKESYVRVGVPARLSDWDLNRMIDSGLTGAALAFARALAEDRSVGFRPSRVEGCAYERVAAVQFSVGEEEVDAALRDELVSRLATDEPEGSNREVLVPLACLETTDIGTRLVSLMKRFGFDSITCSRLQGDAKRPLLLTARKVTPVEGSCRASGG